MMKYCAVVVFVLSSLKVLNAAYYNTANQMPFVRTIVAADYPYYKILMQLGSCHSKLYLHYFVYNK